MLLFSTLQTAFTMVFFCALREFMRMMLNRRRSTRDDEATDGEMPLVALHATGIRDAVHLGIGVTCMYVAPE